MTTRQIIFEVTSNWLMACAQRGNYGQHHQYISCKVWSCQDFTGRKEKAQIAQSQVWWSEALNLCVQQKSIINHVNLTNKHSMTIVLVQKTFSKIWNICNESIYVHVYINAALIIGLAISTRPTYQKKIGID